MTPSQLLPDQRPSPSAAIAIYILFAGLIVRSLNQTTSQAVILGHLGLELAFVALFSLVMWRPGLATPLLHLYFVVQSLVVLALFWLSPNFSKSQIAVIGE